MVRGNHKDLRKWISIFKQNSEQDRTSAAAPSVADMADAESKEQASKTSQPVETTVPSQVSAVQDPVKNLNLT